MANLESLVAEVRASGLPVELSVPGEAFQIGPGVDLAAYRIVQEALTNVRKHAGLVPTRVAVRYGPSALEVEVENDAGTRPNGGADAGHGLVGMRERVAVCGGTLAAGANSEGGFRVHATLLMGACDESRESPSRQAARQRGLRARRRARRHGPGRGRGGQLDADSAAVAVVMLGVTLPLFFVRLSPSLAGLAVLRGTSGRRVRGAAGDRGLDHDDRRGSGGVLADRLDRPPVRAAVAGLASYALFLVVIGQDPDPFGFGDLVFSSLFSVGPWLAGYTLSGRVQREADLERRASILEDEREAQALAAVAAERARIARELHDVIAHSVSVMTVQAGAARLLLAQDPERAREPILAVEETGREALAETRRLLGILRSDMSEAELEPQPGTASLETLVARTPRRASGRADRRGRGVKLAPGLDLAAYRVVQEALTNALTYAGPPTRGSRSGTCATPSSSRSRMTAAPRATERLGWARARRRASACRSTAAPSRPVRIPCADSSSAPDYRWKEPHDPGSHRR